MKARPKSKAWVTNALTGEAVSPNVDWLIDRLALLNPQAAEVDHHAHQIYGHWLSYRHRGDNTAIKIRGTQRPRAERVDAKAGTEKELKRLRTAAKGASDKRLQRAWLGVSGKTRDLVWKPTPPPIIRYKIDRAGQVVPHERADLDVSHLMGVSVRGHNSIMPTRADAVPLIEAALRKHQAMPVAERRKRKSKSNDLADDFALAVCVAYRKLTGRRGDNTWSDQTDSGLFDLCRDIGGRLGITILTVSRIRTVIMSDRYKKIFQKN